MLLLFVLQYNSMNDEHLKEAKSTQPIPSPDAPVLVTDTEEIRNTSAVQNDSSKVRRRSSSLDNRFNGNHILIHILE